jgi:chemotaxis protein MotB
MADDDDDKGGGGAGWIVSYADLMTLLFAAFVVLFALKPEGEQRKIIGITSNIRESFVKIPDIIPEDQRIGPIKSGKWAYQHFKGEQIHQPVIQQFRTAKQMIKVIDDDIDKLKSITREMSGNKADRPEVNPTNKSVEVTRTDNEIKLRILSHVMYDPGQVRPRQSSLPHLEQLGRYLKEINRNFVIEAHTDSAVPDDGRSNWEISIARASHLVNYFESTIGVPKARISASGYGDTRPIAPNETAAGRAQNRRVEIKIRYENP